jgi:hypothetical protein
VTLLPSVALSVTLAVLAAAGVLASGVVAAGAEVSGAVTGSGAAAGSGLLQAARASMVAAHSRVWVNRMGLSPSLRRSGACRTHAFSGSP